MPEIPATKPGSATPAPGRRERKRQDLLDHLTDVAWAMFEVAGFEAVTMEAIAEAADVAKGTLYKHFPVKEALIHHRLRRDLAQAMATGATQLFALPDTEARLRAFCRVSADWTLGYRAAMPHYIRHRFAMAGLAQRARAVERSGLDRALLRLIEAGMRQGDLRSEADTQRLSDALQGLHLMSMVRWQAEPGVSLHDEFDDMVDLFLRGAGAR
jgi:AcrR family transcriptional regulator